MTRLERSPALPAGTPTRIGLARNRAFITAAALVLATIGARLAYLLSGQDRFNGDEAATGIMVHRILQGHGYLFFAGQNYGGALEQYFQAAMYFVTRLPQDRLTLRFVQLALAAGTCALIYACGRRMLPSPGHAVVAALLFAISPWYNVQGVMSMGFYTLSQTLAICGVYFVIRLSDRPAQLRWAGLLGLVCGLAYWNALIAAYALVPALIWLLPTFVRRLRAVVVLLAGAVVGASPLIPWMVRTHHLIPAPHKNVLISVADRLENLFGPVVREFIGVGITDGSPQPGLPWWFARAIEAALALGYVVLVWRRRRGLLSLLRLRQADRSPIDIVLLSAPAIVVLYCSSASAIWTTDPKYLLSAYPLFVLGLAAMLPRRPASFAAAAAIVLVLSGGLCVRYWMNPAWHISHQGMAGQSTLPNSRERDAQLQKAIDYLVATHQRAACSTYWTAMPAKYVAGNRLDVATLFLTRERFPDQAKAVLAAPTVAYLIDLQDPENRYLVTTLESHHISFQTHRFGSLIEVVDHVGPGGRPEQLGWMAR